MSGAEGSGYVLLEDGTLLPGRPVGARSTAFGEVVFTTAMSGYQEIVTDPSFAEQLIAFTAPMIGNYGVNDDRNESDRPAARGVIMRRVGGSDWSRWLAREGIVALEDVDTRSLVLHLRERGAMRAAIVAEPIDAASTLEHIQAQPRMSGRGLVAGVSTAQRYRIDAGPKHVALLDYGCKQSIIRRLLACDATVTVHPHDTSADDVLREQPDAILLSNGPGDPAALDGEVGVVRELIGRAPLLGICLGHQLLARAAGFNTYKLPYGHRGANHPVRDECSGRVLVTSQNHGFAVEGDGTQVTHRSLYDGTVEGLVLADEQACSVQFHPEAGPGPHDAWPIIERWLGGTAASRPAAAPTMVS